MKLTCKCGASIEIDDKHPCPILAAHDFKAMHKSCRASSEPESICFFTAPLIEFTSEALEWMADHPGAVPVVRVTRDDLRRQAANDFASDILSKPLTRGMAPTPAPDPYARFRDAIRDGKRVFVELDGRMHVAHQHFGEMYKDSPSNYFIEGVDIPVKPTQVELDKYGLELTGVCKLLQKGDVYWTIDGTPCFGPAVLNYNGSEGFSGRRWIVQPKAKLCANCGGIIADGNTVYKKGMVLCACRPCPICHTLTAGLGERQICAKCKGGPLTPRDPTDSEIATHASEHDAIVRKLLMQAIKQSLPSHVSQDFRGQIFMKGDCVVFSGYANATTPFCVQIECQHSRPVNLHIGQSATDIVKQARDIVQGMNITKKTKYCAFNIVSDQLIWGVK